VVCPVEQRAQSFARARGLAEKDARLEIERIERDRRAFIQQQFQRDVTDPCHYDLLVNTGRLSLEQAARVVERAYEAKFGL
jgi:cytidylate kinase